MDESIIIKNKLKSCCGFGSEVVVLCIGSDRINGDCLGPVVGELLVTHYNIPAFVYGTLISPVTALNLRSVIMTIKKRHVGCKILAVDSSVGLSSDIGSIKASRGGIKPGSADGKNLPKVGHVSITAVTSDQAPSSIGFGAVRLGFVYSLAKTVAKGIHMFFAEKQLDYSIKGNNSNIC